MTAHRVAKCKFSNHSNVVSYLYVASYVARGNRDDDLSTIYTLLRGKVWAQCSA